MLAELMDQSEVDFIGKMILDEVMELFATVLPPSETKETMKGFIQSSKDIAQLQGERPCGDCCTEAKVRVHMQARLRSTSILPHAILTSTYPLAILTSTYPLANEHQQR